MSWVTGIAAYIVIWWIALFAILPWGNAPDDKPEEGHAPSAPAKPRLALKFLVTTGVAAIIWLVIYLLIKIDVLDFYQLADEMIKEDTQ